MSEHIGAHHEDPREAIATRHGGEDGEGVFGGSMAAVHLDQEVVEEDGVGVGSRRRWGRRRRRMRRRR
jgi:hypothetical protein